MKRAARLAGAFALAAALLAAPRARADEQADFEKARAAYLGKNFQDAEDRFKVLLDPASGIKDRQLVAQARMVLGAVYLAQKRTDDARGIFEKILLEDPQFEPDPLGFPTEVLNVFIDVRSALRDRLNAAAQVAAKAEAERKAKEEADRKRKDERLRVLEQLAAEEKTTVRGSRLVASMPFGAGQFQNRQPVLGWIFFGLESALLVANVSVVPVYVIARDRALEEVALGDPEKKAAQYKDRADTARWVNLGLAGALGVTMGAGIVQAHVAFVDHTTERIVRPLPALRVTPTAAPLVGAGGAGGVVGAAGTF